MIIENGVKHIRMGYKNSFVKGVILYFVHNQKFYQFKTMKDLNNFLSANVKLDSKLKKLLPNKDVNRFVQACLF